MNSFYVDVHTHLTHSKFSEDWQEIAAKLKPEGLGSVVVNGLEPLSNRLILKMADQYEVIKPALGIYPIQGINSLPEAEELPFPIEKFDVWKELDFIESKAAAGEIIAVGECGLDGYWVGSETFAHQEKVFERCIEIANRYDIPIIIHSRKCERRAFEILMHNNSKKVNMHCYCGKTKLAIKMAQEQGYHFSIPANAGKSEAFQKMLRSLPIERILTETDAPYLSPVRGERNEPKNVKATIGLLARFRDLSEEDAKNQVWQNYLNLFEPRS